MPRIALDQLTGNIAISWYDCRNDIVQNRKTQFFGAISKDGGSTFEHFQVSQGQSDRESNSGHYDYLDYTGLAFYYNVFFPVWADNSNSLGNNPGGTFDIHTRKMFVP